MAELFRLAVHSCDVNGCLENCLEAIAEAGRQGADLLVLPEEPEYIAARYGQPHWGTDGQLFEFERHPAFLRFQEAAAEAKVAVIASLMVKAGEGKANLGFFTDAEGKLLGLYNKKHPVVSEEPLVTTPIGADDPFPVFQFRSARIGIAICNDLHFPEQFRIYALKGANLICLPTQYDDYTGDMVESIEKARAVDNQLYIGVSRYLERPFKSGKPPGYAKIIAPDGRILASTGHRGGIAIAEFEPSWSFEYWIGEPLKAVYPDFRHVLLNTRRPDLYGDLVKPRDQYEDAVSQKNRRKGDH